VMVAGLSLMGRALARARRGNGRACRRGKRIDTPQLFRLALATCPDSQSESTMPLRALLFSAVKPVLNICMYLIAMKLHWHVAMIAGAPGSAHGLGKLTGAEASQICETPPTFFALPPPSCIPIPPIDETTIARTDKMTSVAAVVVPAAKRHTSTSALQLSSTRLAKMGTDMFAVLFSSTA
jgi:hypothetical protein